MFKPRPQRVRDPVHNLIEFDTTEFEYALWQVIQTPQFQRLRRIRQLGFSELVFPGATHTRFVHSLGVFHTARQLMRVIEAYVGSHGRQFRPHQAHHALAASLVHDVGHGMFSHAFEALGKEFAWPMARHEAVSQSLIRESEICEVLDRGLGKGFASNVADVIGQEIPDNLYCSVVSSQFDADRLDYMQRDRLMSGVQSSGVDPTWLLANLEVAEVKIGADENESGKVETLVLGPKAAQTAESYVLALFHLYPNLYLHKSTRGVEVIFQALIRRLFFLFRIGQWLRSGLPNNHPFVLFFRNPDSLKASQLLDDTVLWGALPQMVDAEDIKIVRLSIALRDRALTRCVDIAQRVDQLLAQRAEARDLRQARIKLICDAVLSTLREANGGDGEVARFLIDQYVRHPYKRYQDSKTPLNQILIRLGNGRATDMAELSPIIAHAEPFNLCRVYVFRDDGDAFDMVENIIGTKVRELGNA